MSELQNHFKSNHLHHAYLLIGESKIITAELLGLLQSIFPATVDPKFHPDVLWLTKDRLDKDDARFLRQFQTGKDFAGQGRYLVVIFSAMASEAQEVLLKTLEEPATNTYFFLVAPTAEFFRPTILSRVYQLKFDRSNDGEVDDLEKFLGLDVAERGEHLLKRFLDDGQIKDRAELLDWFDRLEVFIHERIDLTRISDNLVLVFKEIVNAKKLLNNQRSSAKMILEYLALIVPNLRKTK